MLESVSCEAGCIVLLGGLLSLCLLNLFKVYYLIDFNQLIIGFVGKERYGLYHI
jgi:hypothetical protein